MAVDPSFREQLLEALADPDVVNTLHNYSDFSDVPSGLHHELGLRHDQSAYGDHRHNGVDSSFVAIKEYASMEISSGTQSFPASAWTTVTAWNTLIQDGDGLYTATGGGGWLIKKKGFYLVTSTICMAANCMLQYAITVNGGIQPGHSRSQGFNHICTRLLALNVNDEVQMIVGNWDNGATVEATSNPAFSDYPSTFDIALLGTI